MTCDTLTPNSERGSALLYILIAVGLLAALSIIVAKNNRGSVATVTDQQAKLFAQEIIDYGNILASAVQKLRLRGCSDTEIGFGNNVWQYNNGTLTHAPGHNPNTPGNECEIFHPDGANATAVIMPYNKGFTIAAGAVDKGSSIVNSIDIVDVGTSADDLVLIINFVPKESCPVINRLLSSFDSDVPPEDDWTGAGIYSGSYTGSAQIGEQESAIAGKLSGCLKWPGGSYGANDVHYYQVLLAR
jgi:hypothetical protein